jgi:hypothetical protein
VGESPAVDPPSLLRSGLCRGSLSRSAEHQISDEGYEAIRDKAVALGLVVKGLGSGGSIALAEGIEAHKITVYNKQKEEDGNMWAFMKY